MDDCERGGATGVEMAVLWAVILLLIGAVVQVALTFYAGQLALTAAQDGVRSGSYHDAVSTERARQEAQSFITRAAGTALQGVVVSAELDGQAGVLRVHVTGTALSLIPGVDLPVDKTAVGAVERVAP